MNNASLVLLENTKLKKLEDYKLDEKSISEFKSKIKQVDDETKNNLGKELFELIIGLINFLRCNCHCKVFRWR